MMTSENRGPRDIRALNRRDILRLGMAAGLAGTAVGAGAVSQPARAAAHKTNAHIVIAGAGAAGLAVANRLAEQLDGAKITLIDARKPHYYQPGFTLVAAGLKPASYVTSTTSSYVPNGVTLIEDRVAAFDPDANKVVTATGQSLSYDYLVVTTGMILDFDAIEGMELDKVGQNGLGALYAGPQYAAATWKAMSKFADEGGRGLFLRPATEMKCAGAPLKYTFLTDSHLRRRGNRGKAELVYAAHSASLFSVPIVNEKVRMLFLDRGVTTLHHHVLTGIDPGAKRATFQTDGGSETIDYDFINVIPPMRAPAAVRNSPLAWQEGKFAADGWMEVDKPTLRHKRYPNVFGVGDVAGVPKGKTAASVKWQVPVAVDHLVADITGTASSAAYNGYTSCPLITQLGRAMLVEFDYNNNLVPSFPGVIAPLEELWVTWVMKTMALKPTYISMLRGAA